MLSDNAKNKKEVRSCIMKNEQKVLSDYLELGVKVLDVYTVNDALVVEVPIDKVEEFVGLSLSVMQPGFWNEYLGIKTGFFGKFLNGETFHLPLTPENQTKINLTMQQFVSSWKIDTDLWLWLAEVEIYGGWINK